MLITFANLGVGPANVYFVSRKDYELEQVIKGTLLLGMFLSVAAIIIGVLVVLVGGNSLFHGVSFKLLLSGLLIVPVSLLFSFMAAILQGLQDFRRFNLMYLLPQTLTLALATCGLYFMNGGVQVLIWCHIISYSSSLALGLWFFRHALALRTANINRQYLKSCLRYGWKAHLSNIFTFFNYRIDMFLLNAFLSPIAVGIYAVAVQIAERMWILSQAVSTVLFPSISELKNQELIRQQLTPLLSRWVLLLTTIASLVVGLTSRWIVVTLFGPSFREASTALQVLLPGIVTAATSRVVANDIAGRGRPEINTYIAAVALLVNIVSNVILIPKMGVIGAALSTTFSYTLHALMTMTAYSTISGVKWHKILVFNATLALRSGHHAPD
jgi:O-antigen/teichoic acid export membrane protein